MKLNQFVITPVFVLSTFAFTSVLAADFEYFKAQSCSDLTKELDGLTKSEASVKESIKKKESKANTQAVLTALLVGWPFWGDTDHGDANNMLAEIRTDSKFVTRAMKTNKCT
jgi:hypothetical protein